MSDLRSPTEMLCDPVNKSKAKPITEPDFSRLSDHMWDRLIQMHTCEGAWAMTFISTDEALYRRNLLSREERHWDDRVVSGHGLSSRVRVVVQAYMDGKARPS